jgi:hypothetical protein
MSSANEIQRTNLTTGDVVITGTMDQKTGEISANKTIRNIGGSAGIEGLGTTMVAAGALVDAHQARLVEIMKGGITAAEVGEMNSINNSISLLGSAQKALNNAQAQAQRMIAA